MMNIFKLLRDTLHDRLEQRRMKRNLGIIKSEVQATQIQIERLRLELNALNTGIRQWNRTRRVLGGGPK